MIVIIIHSRGQKVKSCFTIQFKYALQYYARVFLNNCVGTRIFRLAELSDKLHWIRSDVSILIVRLDAKFKLSRIYFSSFLLRFRERNEAAAEKKRANEEIASQHSIINLPASSLDEAVSSRPSIISQTSKEDAVHVETTEGRPELSPLEVISMVVQSSLSILFNFICRCAWTYRRRDAAWRLRGAVSFIQRQGF